MSPLPGAPVVLVGGPAEYDGGRRWTTGRVVDWLPPHDEAPLVWIYTTWAPWRRAFAQYVYAYRGLDGTGAILMAYTGPLEYDKYAVYLTGTTKGPS